MSEFLSLLSSTTRYAPDDSQSFVQKTLQRTGTNAADDQAYLAEAVSRPHPQSIRSGQTRVGTTTQGQSPRQTEIEGSLSAARTTTAEWRMGAYPSKNIVENAVHSKDHTTLVAAVKAAGLVDTLESKGPFTAFAPTNEAFGKLPNGTVATLVKPENKATLTKILTYHVVPGRL